MRDRNTTLSTTFTDDEMTMLRQAARLREWSLSHVLRRGALTLADLIASEAAAAATRHRDEIDCR